MAQRLPVEMKASAALDVLTGRESVTNLAQRLGVSPSTIKNWVAVLNLNAARAFDELYSWERMLKDRPIYIVFSQDGKGGVTPRAFMKESHAQLVAGEINKAVSEIAPSDINFPPDIANDHCNEIRHKLWQLAVGLRTRVEKVWIETKKPDRYSCFNRRELSGSWTGPT